MTDTDIVTRLRNYYTADAESFHIEHPICHEAADELERLAAQLVEVGKVAIDRGNQLIAANAEIERLLAEVQRLSGGDTVTADWDEARAVWVCRKLPEA